MAFLLEAGCCCPARVDRVLLILSPTDGLRGCLHPWAVVQNAAVNEGAPAFGVVGYLPRSGVAGLNGNCTSSDCAVSIRTSRARVVTSARLARHLLFSVCLLGFGCEAVSQVAVIPTGHTRQPLLLSVEADSWAC